jgi:predicted membrane protein
VRAVFGNVELDFRNAVLPAAPVELDVSAAFGNIEITVPPHLAVESSGNAVLGNFDHVERAAPDLAPEAPVLRISGTSVFGNVEITMRIGDDDHRRLPPRK